MSDEDVTIHRGTGCLWTDLGYDNAAEMTVKSRLCHYIADAIREGGWTPAEAAREIDMDAEVIRNAQNGRLSKVSAGDLFEMIIRLGCDIGISVGRPENERGSVFVWRPDED